MGKLLVTSSDERTWDFNRSMIFLGNWCKRFDRKHKWIKADAEISKPYGISFIQKEHNSVIAKNIEKKLIKKIIVLLNPIMKINYDERMWSILIGPWLRRYSTLMINRIGTLEKCLNDYNISDIILETSKKNYLIFENSKLSMNAFENDVWNQYLYYEILQFFNKKKINIIKISHQEKKSKNKLKNRLSFKILIINIIKFISKFTNLLTYKNKIALINIYFKKWDQIKLHFKLSIFPYLRFENNINKKILVDNNLRHSLKKELEKEDFENLFEKISFSLFFKIFPICYLEGFHYYKNLTFTKTLPLNPKLIISFVNLDTDEMIKFWTISKLEQGSNLLIYQHGNNYGTHRYVNPSIDEDVADKFITWGWGGENKKYLNSKIINRYFHYQSHRKTFNKFKNIYLIENTMNPSYETFDSYFEYDKYFNEQLEFVQCLKKDIKNNLIIKLHSGLEIYSKYQEELRWKNFDSSLNFIKPTTNFRKIIKKSKIIIFSYDSSGFLECLANNIPTMCFWQNKFDHLRDDVKADYKLLLDSEIIFLSPIDIAKKINIIYNDIDTWWYSKKVQDAKVKFTNKYANTDNKDLYQLIKSLY
tara:strand:+ start:846 stop:2615 length:1770 start_codon:yes stop_codon:yes gene_type:complete